MEFFVKIKRLILVFLISTFISPLCAKKINKIRVLGTHNSYHEKSWLPALTYRYHHKPLSYQLSKLKIRQLELDIHFEGPELNVFHKKYLDPNSNCKNLSACFSEINIYRKSKPEHEGIFIFLEIKDENETQKSKFLKIAKIKKEILNHFKKDEIVLWSDVKKRAKSLTDSVTNNGWISEKDFQGKVMFIMINGYIKSSTKDLLFYCRAPEESLDKAVICIDDPKKDFHLIKKLVKKGFIVRTHADYQGKEKALKDYSRAVKAVKSGAQIISTDYPEPKKGSYYFNFRTD